MEVPRNMPGSVPGNFSIRFLFKILVLAFLPCFRAPCLLHCFKYHAWLQHRGPFRSQYRGWFPVTAPGSFPVTTPGSFPVTTPAQTRFDLVLFGSHNLKAVADDKLLCLTDASSGHVLANQSLTDFPRISAAVLTSG